MRLLREQALGELDMLTSRDNVNSCDPCDALCFVSHAWQCKFMDVVRALEAFFVDKPGAIIWMDLISTSQHATFDQPPE